MANYSNMKHNEEKIILIGYSTTKMGLKCKNHSYNGLDEYCESERPCYSNDRAVHGDL